MLDFLFGNITKTIETEKKAEKLEKEVESLTKTLKHVREDRDEATRNTDKYIQRLEDNHSYSMEMLITKNEDAIARLSENQELVNLNFEASQEARVQKVQTEADAKVAKAKIEAEESARKSIDNAVEAQHNAEIVAAGAIAASEEKDETISNLEDVIDGLNELVQFLATKIPNVDLTKFNINVEVPAQEVTIVNGQKPEAKKQ